VLNCPSWLYRHSPFVEKWKKDFVKLAGDNPLHQLRARRNVNTFLLNARTLFGRRMQRRLREHGLPVPPNPFEGVDLEKQGNTKYVSTIKSKDLLRTAKEELEETDPEAWKVILLALGAGLRRREIDRLCTTQLDFEDSLIRVVNTEDFEAKTDDSLGIVYVDAALLGEIGRHVDHGSLFVIDPGVAPAVNRAPGYYRCKNTFKRTTKWLAARTDS